MSEKSPKSPKKTKAATEAPAPAESATPGKSLGELAKERAAARKTVAQSDKFVFVKNPEKPIAPQAQVIVNTIAAAGAEGVLRPALVENLKPVLVTRQPAERILTYYQASLVENGLIRIENPARTTKSAPASAEPQEAGAAPE